MGNTGKLRIISEDEARFHVPDLTAVGGEIWRGEVDIRGTSMVMAAEWATTYAAITENRVWFWNPGSAAWVWDSCWKSAEVRALRAYCEHLRTTLEAEREMRLVAVQ